MDTNNDIEDEIDSTQDELLYEFMDREELYSTEGPKGVQNLGKIIRTIGYDNIESFLMDNSGVVEEIVNWIAFNEVDDWKAMLRDHLTGEE